MNIADMVAECIKRLALEPTAPIDRVVNAVTHYHNDKTRRHVRRLVVAELGKPK